ncbi:NAD-dependent epimerase/dehydratase family protein [Brevibacterium daeguense]|uniref:NAD-dependent epimerase/dehydratase family protein n=1 Tax=Brevibacterium daeguense TaxID=909936 RepID=A0ABP8EH26_9MICO
MTKAFAARGAEVVVVDRNPPPADDERVSTIIGDLNDPEVRLSVITEGTAGVIHCAAITSVLQSAGMPAETYQANVANTAELLELCRKHSVPRFLLASTNAVVGDVGEKTITADMPLAPLTPYGATKAAGEMLLSGYAGAYGITASALRLTNVYGPGMKHKDSFVPRLMRAALSGDTVRIHGDGRQRRDLVYLDDVVAGVLRVWDSGFTGRAILGSGRSISVLEMVETARRVTGRLLPSEHIPAPRGEMPAVVVDLSASERELGYHPTVSFAEGLAAVWQDFLHDELHADRRDSPELDSVIARS